MDLQLIHDTILLLVNIIFFGGLSIGLVILIKHIIWSKFKH